MNNPTGRIFFQGGSQAVRIPMPMRFPQHLEEVEIFPHADDPTVICLRPVDPALIRDSAVSRLNEVQKLLESWSARPGTDQWGEAPEVLYQIRKILQ